MASKESLNGTVQVHLPEPGDQDNTYLADDEKFQFRVGDLDYDDDNQLYELDAIASEYKDFTQDGLSDSFYQEWEAGLNSTFGGVYVDDETKK